MRKRKWTRSQAFSPSGRKTFRSALCHLLQSEFPGQFGPTVTHLFAEKVEEVFLTFHPDTRQLKPGQVLWAAVAVDDPPARNKSIEDTRLVPVILDLVSEEDIDDAIAGGRRDQTRREKIVRLCQQAYDQGGVLSYPDLALLLHLSPSTISRAVCKHEKETDKTVPRRGTVHDMGRSISHKSQICRKRLVEKKPTSQVASETNHDPEEVEYYVQCLRRIRMCLDAGMDTKEISLATGHAQATVKEYQILIDELELPMKHAKEETGKTPQKKQM